MTEQEAQDKPSDDELRRIARNASTTGNYSGGVKALRAVWERARHVPVEVTADMVERAAMVLYGDYRSEHEGARLSDFQDVARAVLSAALGGGE